MTHAQCTKIAEEWLASQITHDDAPESLARLLMVAYKTGVVDGINMTKRLLNKSGDIPSTIRVTSELEAYRREPSQVGKGTKNDR
jgi:hypothetical protein